MHIFVKTYFRYIIICSFSILIVTKYLIEYDTCINVDLEDIFHVCLLETVAKSNAIVASGILFYDNYSFTDSNHCEGLATVVYISLIYVPNISDNTKDL